MTASRMRVGLVVPRFPPFRGGLESYTEQAAGALSTFGCAVTVLTQAPRHMGLPAKSVRDGYTVERYPLPVDSSFDIPSPAAVRAAVQTWRFDVLWAHSYHTPLAWLVAERAQAPLVLTPHYHGTGHTWLRKTLHRPYRLAGRRLLAASRHIIVDTEAERALLERDFPGQIPRQKVAVVPLAVNDPRMGPAYPVDNPIVLTVARQEPYKRTDLLVHAVAVLHSRRLPLRLVVVGAGHGLPSLRRLASQLGVQESVTFTGLVDRETLGRWWASASLYVTASEREAFGIAMAQALVAGLPVVASKIAAHCEVVGRAGPLACAELIDINDRRKEVAIRYADAIESYLAEPHSAVADAGRERRNCALSTPEMMADQLIDVLTSAAA